MGRLVFSIFWTLLVRRNTGRSIRLVRWESAVGDKINDIRSPLMLGFWNFFLFSLCELKRRCEEQTNQWRVWSGSTEGGRVEQRLRCLFFVIWLYFVSFHEQGLGVMRDQDSFFPRCFYLRTFPDCFWTLKIFNLNLKKSGLRGGGGVEQGGCTSRNFLDSLFDSDVPDQHCFTSQNLYLIVAWQKSVNCWGGTYIQWRKISRNTNVIFDAARVLFSVPCGINTWGLAKGFCACSLWTTPSHLKISISTVSR